VVLRRARKDEANTVMAAMPTTPLYMQVHLTTVSVIDVDDVACLMAHKRPFDQCVL